MGRTAVELLLARMRGDADETPEHRLLETELVVRESTAPAAEGVAA
jgi:DNA-binding LacI/PurR family transcriptional regulator